jgi:hypothetical protein
MSTVVGKGSQTGRRPNLSPHLNPIDPIMENLADQHWSPLTPDPFEPANGRFRTKLPIPLASLGEACQSNQLRERSKSQIRRVSPIAAGLDTSAVVTEMAQDPEQRFRAGQSKGSCHLLQAAFPTIGQ